MLLDVRLQGFEEGVVGSDIFDVGLVAARRQLRVLASRGDIEAHPSLYLLSTRLPYICAPPITSPT